MSNLDNYDVDDLVNRYDYLASEYEFASELSKVFNPASLLNLAGVDEDIQVFRSAFISLQFYSFQDLKIFYFSLLLIE